MGTTHDFELIREFVDRKVVMDANKTAVLVNATDIDDLGVGLLGQEGYHEFFQACYVS